MPDEIKLRERSYIESIVLHYNQLDKNESEKLHQKISSAFVDLKNIFEQDDISSVTKPDSWIGWLRSVEGGLSSSDSKNFLDTQAKLWDIKGLIHNGNDWEYCIQSLFGGENNSEKFRCYDEAFSNIYDCFIEELDEFPDVMNSFGLKLL